MCKTSDECIKQECTIITSNSPVQAAGRLLLVPRQIGIALKDIVVNSLLGPIQFGYY